MLDDRQWSYLRGRYSLTVREQQVARLVCEGLGTRVIAARLAIRPATVKTHIRNIYRKMRVTNRMNMLLRFIMDVGGSATSRAGT
jgi:DNA-binding NarL/FixJ family response regulator